MIIKIAIMMIFKISMMIIAVSNDGNSDSDYKQITIVLIMIIFIVEKIKASHY